MGPGATYAVVTFCAGVLLLLGWLYVTTDNPRSGALLKKSLLLFVVPILVTPAQLFQFPLGMWGMVAFEEGLKAFASTRERNQLNKFWLVVLFGVWELALSKPFWGIVVAQSGESLSRVGLAGILYATTLPVLMHAVTAAIYAFTFERRLWLAFIASWVIHTSFNETVFYFGLSATAAIIETAVLGLIFIGLVRGQRLLAASDLA